MLVKTEILFARLPVPEQLPRQPLAGLDAAQQIGQDGRGGFDIANGLGDFRPVGVHDALGGSHEGVQTVGEGDQVAHRNRRRNSIRLNKRVQVGDGDERILRKLVQIVHREGEVRQGFFIERIAPHVADGVIQPFGGFVHAFDETGGGAGDLLKVKGCLGMRYGIIRQRVSCVRSGVNRHVLISQKASLLDHKARVSSNHVLAVDFEVNGHVGAFGPQGDAGNRSHLHSRHQN